MITASMATIPSRKDILRKSVESIYPQVDKIHIAFNYRDEPIPEWIQEYPNIEYSVHDNSMGDAAKFYGAHGANGYVLIVDDDMLYPPDFASKLLGKVDRYSCVVCVAGSMMPGKVNSYYKDRKIVATARTKKQCKSDTFVHIGTTCGMAYNTEHITFPLSVFEKPNMADVWMSIHCHRQSIKILCIKKNQDWLKSADNMRERYTIYGTRDEHDDIQAEACNTVSWGAL